MGTNNAITLFKGARAQNSYNFISKFNLFSWLGSFEIDLISGNKILRTTQDHFSLQLQSNENMKISMFQNNSVFFGVQKRCTNDQKKKNR